MSIEVLCRFINQFQARELLSWREQLRGKLDPIRSYKADNKDNELARAKSILERSQKFVEDGQKVSGVALVLSIVY